MIDDFIQKYLETWGVSKWVADIGSWVIMVLAIALICFLTNFIAKKFLLKIVRFAIKKTKTKWDDKLVERKVFHRLSQFAPAIIIFFSASIFSPYEDTIHRIAIIYMVLAGLLVLNAFFNAVIDIYQTVDISRERPIKGYIQLVKIIVYIVGAIYIISVIIGQSPWGLITGLGAMTAVIMLVFKDSILGFVASIQLSAYDIVRKGDWITMPKYGVDGDVVDVSLNTIKIQNFDKTIVTIPTYMLIQDSVQNWRGMGESGGRRIKRNINIDMNSIRFCDEDMLKRFEKFDVLTNYINTKTKEVKNYNNENNIDTSEWINGRRLTNVGTYRAYIVEYLKRHPKIHKNDFTFLIRHLQPAEMGLPIQLYIFTNDTNWVNYEGIQADIFDHLLAVLHEFDLRVFQNPSGGDVQSLAGAIKGGIQRL